MSLSVHERERVWDEFLAAWPLPRLASMSLADYATAQSKDCFTYWAEARTEQLGSIWGGSAFKFGIYARSSKLPPKQGDAHTHYGTTHAWAAKYGATEVQAFKTVRQAIARVAQASHAGDLAEIDAVDLGPVFKWKVAFLYQNRQTPRILAVLSARDLCASLGRFVSTKESMVALQVEARHRFAQPSVFEATDACWDARTGWLRQHTLTEQMRTEIEADAERFMLVNTTQKMVGVRLVAGGLPFAFTRDDKSVTVFAPAGGWIAACQQLVKREYHAYESRHSNLSSCCPEAGNGHDAVALKLGDMDDFEHFLLAYSGEGAADGALPIEDVTDMNPSHTPVPRNQILFGPPGSGKTYATIDEALRILDPQLLQAQQQNPNADDARSLLKARFDRLKADGQIVFVTFHQSYSYEDFVEGIRAVPPEVGATQVQNIQYRVENGVFLNLCESARANKAFDEHEGIQQDAAVWKLSIGEANGETETRQYCFDHDEARIGWPQAGDLAEVGLNLADPKYQLGSKQIASLENFSRNMEPGDVVVCLESQTSVSAVGVVTGSYEHSPNPPSPVRKDYVQRLPVKWLWKNISLPIVSLNGGNQLVQQTAYRLGRIRWPDLYDALAKAGLSPSAQAAKAPPLPHVLIIDEINRGNVSRIFGELITLVEDSKRDGQPEALSVTLPYSRRSFSVPGNVYLLGTMNTADRSLASLDVALRRRFSFKAMPPLPALLADTRVEGQIPVNDLLTAINLRIEALLGPDFLLGHAWFMPLRADKRLEHLADIFRLQVMPQLQEYFFDDWERIRWVLNDHRKDQFNEYCFIQLRQVNMGELFGAGVQAPTRPLWEVNPEAFNHVGSYLATIDVALLEADA